MQYLLVILEGLAVGCAVAASVTISMVPGAGARLREFLDRSPRVKT
jgi:hypothetical protein